MVVEHLNYGVDQKPDIMLYAKTPEIRGKHADRLQEHEPRLDRLKPGLQRSHLCAVVTRRSTQQSKLGNDVVVLVQGLLDHLDRVAFMQGRAAGAILGEDTIRLGYSWDNSATDSVRCEGAASRAPRPVCK